MRVEAVIPAYNAEWCLARSIGGLLAAGFPADHIIVVDDASTDRTADIAAGLGVRLVRQLANGGAAAARNAGAAEADGDLILFVDADVVVYPDVRARIIEAFEASGALDALFGAYDDRPECLGVVSRFRNLLHHFVHLHGPERPHSFWTGCGAVRRATFERLGGFDPRLRMMEDVEFGLRLTSMGGLVRLEHGVKARHLKCWSLSGMVRMDILDRAIPWSRLLLFRHGLVNEFNIDLRHRASALIVLALIASIILSILNPVAVALSLMVLLGFLALNWRFHALLFRAAGWWTGLASIPLHLIHVLCAIIGLGWVFVVEFLPWRLFNRALPVEALPMLKPRGQSAPGRLS